MELKRRHRTVLALAAWMLGMGVWWHGPLAAQDTVARNSFPPPSEVQVIAIQGTNWWLAPAGATDYVLAATRVPQHLRSGDRVRTGRHTRLFVQTAHLGVIQIPPLSTVEIALPSAERETVLVRILNGMMYFFHRGSPRDLEVQSESATAAIRGTEFVAEALPDGGLAVRVVDGRVALSNGHGTVEVRGGEEGVAPTGDMPTITPMLQAKTAIQWFLYYPAVLDPDELPWTEGERAPLTESLKNYRAGDLTAALRNYPPERKPVSASEAIYHAALSLAVGQVEPALALMENDFTDEPSAQDLNEARRALLLMAASVQQLPRPPGGPPTSSGGWLAESYYGQSESRLPEALAAARRAAELSPAFGFAWVRVAELEFGFGRVAEAENALRNALSLSPRHAAAHTLRGFIHGARGEHAAAMAAFGRAIDLHPGLGDAWLGRGVERIHRGQLKAGLQDLEVAAALEPQRAVLRSYLAKAFEANGLEEKARKELELARELDPNDPTSRLYEALLDQRHNRINEGIENLETSKRLNDQRSLFRSRHLLDRDQAVRGANLAALYRDAGMVDVARREAIDAVNTDYANASAHLFLANAYHELRDPGQIDLRYETPWFTEFLLANLLSPVGAGTLSQTVSQQEYSRLFERNRLGFVSSTEYRSNGDWIQSGAHYGVLNNFEYAVEEDYRAVNGQRRNNDLEQLTLSLKLKQQLGPNDSIYFQAVYYDAEGGDLTRVYDPDDPAYFRSEYRYEEKQEPLLLAGYHHQWNPRQHTLVLAGRLHDELTARDPHQPALIVSKDPGGAVTGTLLTGVEQDYRSELEIYSTELQHIADFDPVTFIVGSRVQTGHFDTESRQRNLADMGAALPEPLEQSSRPDVERLSVYGYGQWRVAEPLSLFGGLSYDHLQYPANHRLAPLADDEDSRHALHPKAGFVWQPSPSSTLRGAYTRSLGGVSLEQSVRLEPSQVAGFNQAWRSLIPESAAGSQSGARLEMGSLEWDQRFPTRTYLGIRGELGRSQVSRDVGVFDLPFLAEPGTTPERLDYEERTLRVTLNQLVGDDWSFGGQYRLSHAELKDRFPRIPGSVPHFFEPYELKPRQDLESVLHQVRLYALLNHDSGFFAEAEALWSLQSNHGYEPDRPGDEFWHGNVWAGYRFAGRKVEVRLGILNVTDRDYRLNPLNLTAELPRERTYTASLRLSL